MSQDIHERYEEALFARLKTGEVALSRLFDKLICDGIMTAGQIAETIGFPSIGDYEQSLKLEAVWQRADEIYHYEQENKR